MILFSNKSIRGFTLVEMLVSLALFTAVITIAVGAIYSAQAVNTKLEQNQIVLDEVNLVMEMIARDIRYGSVFYCDTAMPGALLVDRKDCPHISTSGGGVIIFKPVVKLSGSIDYSKDRVAYYSLNGTIYRDEYKEGNIANKISYQVTSPDVNIRTLNFYVVGTNSFQDATPDYNQPLITIVITGTTIPSKATIDPAHFNLQTSVTSRRFDN
jgi:prepilin-type N-terminal cleavage/methylation domain-containing protein